MAIDLEAIPQIRKKIREKIKSLITSNAFFQSQLLDTDSNYKDDNDCVVYEFDFLQRLPTVSSNDVSIAVHHNNLERTNTIRTEIFNNVTAFFFVDVLINEQDLETLADLQEYYKIKLLGVILSNPSLGGLVGSIDYLSSEVLQPKQKLNKEVLRLTFEVNYNLKYLKKI